MFRLKFVLLLVFCAGGITSSYSQADSTDLASTFKSLFKTKDYPKAIKTGLEWKAYMQREGIAESDSAKTARTLMDLASCYNSTQQYRNAEATILEALQIMPSDSTGYCAMISALGNVKTVQGKYVEADSILHLALDSYKHYHLENSQSYISCLVNLGILQFDRGFVVEAQQLHLQALTKWNDNNFGEKPQIGRIYNELYRVETEFRNLAQAQIWLENAINVLSKFYPPDGEVVLGRKNLYAKLLMNKGELDKAEPYLVELMKLQAEKRGKNTLEYAESMAVLTCIDQKLGKIEEALELTLLQHPIYLAHFGFSGSKTFENQFNRVALLLDAQKMEEARVLIHSIQDSISKDPEGSLRKSARLFEALAACEQMPSNSIPFRKRALSLYQEAAPGIIRAAAAETAILLARDYLLVGQLDSAEQLLSLFDETVQSKETHEPNALRLLFFWGYFNQLKGNEEQAVKDWSKLVESQQEDLSRDLFLLNEDDRLGRLSKSKYISYMLLTQCRNKDMRDAGIMELALDFHLYTKSLLLYTANKIRENMFADSSLAPIFAAWTDTRYRLAWCYTQSEKYILSQKIDIGMLHAKADSLENDIARRSAAFVSVDLRKPYSWTNVRDKLLPGEAAIEITRHKIFETDTISYVVFVIRHGANAPIAIPFSDAFQLDQILVEQYLAACAVPTGKGQTIGLYDAFWKKLEPYLKDVSRIFVGTDGAFFKINIGAIQLPGGGYVADSFDLRPVFSLKDIHKDAPPLGQRDQTMPLTAFLAGNPTFLQKPGDIDVVAAKRSVTETEDSSTLFRSFDYSLRQVDETRGLTLSPLPGSEKEVLDITKLLEKKGWHTTVVTGKEATEDLVKSIRNPTVLHLATHGYFLSNVRSGTAGLSRSVLERNPMLRSMIFFAGAQNTLDKAPIGSEDGILTAYEAQNLNLEGTELVVLSACQTAQGKIQNGEGVYGLQRALRIAGAKSVLISLWDVDDKVGREFMIQFYTHWLNGATKAEAFRKAQLETKKKHPLPFYWAGFMLLE